MSYDSVVLILSGGMDSTTLLYHCLQAKKRIPLVLSFDYGQRHRRELEAAAQLTELWTLKHYIVDLRWMRHVMGGSALTDANTPVPHGHYEDASMRATVVPHRNLVMLAIAASAAQGANADAIAYGAHGGDHHIYPDCRPEFVGALNHLLTEGNTREPAPPVGVYAPFLSWTKGQIARHGHGIGVPFSMTWTCYEGAEVHCGQCGACVERREAFVQAKLDDPTAYAAAA